MTPVVKLRQISPQEFATLGMQAVAYVKRITVNDTVVFATVRQNDIEPVSVH